MTCNTPPALTDAVLLQYLDGEVDDGVSGHLVACSSCRSRADELAIIQGYLKRNLLRIECPPPLLLAEFQENMLSKKEAKHIRTHLDLCPYCRAEREMLTVFHESVRFDLELAPIDSIRILIGKLANKVEGVIPPSSQFIPQPVKLRGDASPTQMYLAGEYQVIFELIPDQGLTSTWILNGLLIGGDPLAWSASLTQAGQAISASTITSTGTFIMEGISPGEYDLVLAEEHERILIHSVSIPPRKN